MQDTSFINWWDRETKYTTRIFMAFASLCVVMSLKLDHLI